MATDKRSEITEHSIIISSGGKERTKMVKDLPKKDRLNSSTCRANLDKQKKVGINLSYTYSCVRTAGDDDVCHPKKIQISRAAKKLRYGQRTEKVMGLI